MLTLLFFLAEFFEFGDLLGQSLDFRPEVRIEDECDLLFLLDILDLLVHDLADDLLVLHSWRVVRLPSVRDDNAPYFINRLAEDVAVPDFILADLLHPDMLFRSSPNIEQAFDPRLLFSGLRRRRRFGHKFLDLIPFAFGPFFMVLLEPVLCELLTVPFDVFRLALVDNEEIAVFELGDFGLVLLDLVDLDDVLEFVPRVLRELLHPPFVTHCVPSLDGLC